MLLNVVQCTGRPPTTEHYLALSVSGAEVRNCGLWSKVAVFSLNRPSLFLENPFTSQPPSLLPPATAVLLSLYQRKGAPENILFFPFYVLCNRSKCPLSYESVSVFDLSRPQFPTSLGQAPWRPPARALKHWGNKGCSRLPQGSQAGE